MTRTPRTRITGRAALGAIALLGVALLAGACDDGGYGYAYGPPPRRVACGAFSTCATCTPQNGCGWCFSVTTGLCVDDPSDCPAASTTGWTWEPTGCRAPLDASAVVVGDAGARLDASPEGTADASDAAQD
jgi:hypothetical protein